MKALAVLLLAAASAHAAPDAFFDGSRSVGGGASAVQGNYRANLRRHDAPAPKSERPAPPPLGDDKEKAEKEEGLSWGPDVKAGLWGAVIGGVLAGCLAGPFAAILAPVLIGAAIGFLAVGGVSRAERAYAKAQAKKKKD
jgi:predicted lipid-binding transport protein (Tim44 family)